MSATKKCNGIGIAFKIQAHGNDRFQRMRRDRIMERSALLLISPLWAMRAAYNRGRGLACCRCVSCARIASYSTFSSCRLLNILPISFNRCCIQNTYVPRTCLNTLCFFPCFCRLRARTLTFLFFFSQTMIFCTMIFFFISRFMGSRGILF